jgi:hypothetical protein
MKTLAAVLLLAVLSACGSGGVDPATPRPAKDLPYAPPPPPLPAEGVMCPADVRQCPDGSFVSRSPDNGCAFKACPGASKP